MSQRPKHPPLVEPPLIELSEQAIPARGKSRSQHAHDDGGNPQSLGRSDQTLDDDGFSSAPLPPNAPVSPAGSSDVLPRMKKGSLPNCAERRALPPKLSAASRTEQPGIENETQALANHRFLARHKLRALGRWPFWVLSRGWELGCLLVLLAVVAAVPVLQLASLGYLLRAAANVAACRPWRSAVPGLRLAGRLGSFATMSCLTWLPVWLVSDLAYSSQLLNPHSTSARNWRLLAFAITTVWLIHLIWAAVRGGRWWHFLWPAPLRFLKTAWRFETWSTASDRLYITVSRLNFPQLWWLGLRAAMGAMLWIGLPVSMMIIGQRADDFGPAVLIGLLGALGMTGVMLFLPFLQIQMAATNRFKDIFNIKPIRHSKRYAPWAHALALSSLCLLSIPLYLLRIEATPEDLVWAPALIFVLLMLPAKLSLGSALRYAKKREAAPHSTARHWALRRSAGLVGLASVLLYVGALYVAQLVAGQGAFVMYFQHAFLVPAPLL